MPETATTTQKALTLKAQRDAMRDGKILGFECAKCKRRQITPMARCANCGTTDVKVAEFATTGKVVTYTIQQVASEQFLNEVPFAWVIVELDDGGPRVSGWMPFIARPGDLPVGQPVKFISSYKPGMMFEKA
jgi:uncharacterized OB-fold protein